MRAKIHRVLLVLFFAAFVGLMSFSSRLGDTGWVCSMLVLALLGMRLHASMSAAARRDASP